jgi:hypothetical protein
MWYKMLYAIRGPNHENSKYPNKDWTKVARPERFELPTLWFEARCSIQLSYGR